MKPTSTQILTAVSQSTKIPEDDIKGTGSKTAICEARAVYFELCRQNGIKQSDASGYINRARQVMQQYIGLRKKPCKVAVYRAQVELTKILLGGVREEIKPLKIHQYRITDMSSRYSGKMFCVFKDDELVYFSEDVRMCRQYVESVKNPDS